MTFRVLVKNTQPERDGLSGVHYFTSESIPVRSLSNSALRLDYYFPVS